MDWHILCNFLDFTTIYKVFPKGIVNFFHTPQKLTFSQQNGQYPRLIYQIP